VSNAVHLPFTKTPAFSLQHKSTHELSLIKYTTVTQCFWFLSNGLKF